MIYLLYKLQCYRFITKRQLKKLSTLILVPSVQPLRIDKVFISNLDSFYVFVQPRYDNTVILRRIFIIIYIFNKLKYYSLHLGEHNIYSFRIHYV